MHFYRLGYERGSESRAREPQSEHMLYICIGIKTGTHATPPREEPIYSPVTRSAPIVKDNSLKL